MTKKIEFFYNHSEKILSIVSQYFDADGLEFLDFLKESVGRGITLSYAFYSQHRLYETFHKQAKYFGFTLKFFCFAVKKSKENVNLSNRTICPKLLETFDIAIRAFDCERAADIWNNSICMNINLDHVSVFTSSRVNKYICSTKQSPRYSISVFFKKIKECRLLTGKYTDVKPASFDFLFNKDVFKSIYTGDFNKEEEKSKELYIDVDDGILKPAK